jgi:undecaprenyl-diphosphatase
MIEKIIELDERLFLYLNGLHYNSLDTIMYWISEKYTWIPFYAVLLGIIIWKFKTKAIYILLGIGLVILFADQFTSGFMKPYFERFRPCHDPDLAGMVYLVKGCGGKFGFASSHAANTFGLATFVFLLFNNIYKYTGLLFVWAFIVSYSRIYLGAHYPLDIIVGGIIGIIIGWLIYVLMLRTVFKNNPEKLYSPRK